MEKWEKGEAEDWGKKKEMLQLKWEYPQEAATAKCLLQDVLIHLIFQCN